MKMNTMAKRIFLALVIVTLTAGGAFAQTSVGGGGNFAVNFDSLKESGDEILMTTTGGGLFGFFDMGYLEADVGLVFGSQKMKMSVMGFSVEVDGPKVSILTLGLYGKYPIDLGGFILSPMLGIQYDIGLSAENENGVKLEGDDLSDYLNRFWVKFGVSADFNLTETLYLRPSFLYGINFGTKDLDDTQGTSAFYHGLDIRVAIGFRL